MFLNSLEKTIFSATCSVYPLARCLSLFEKSLFSTPAAVLIPMGNYFTLGDKGDKESLAWEKTTFSTTC